MSKKYFDTKSGSLEEKITKIATEQPSIQKPEPNVKLKVERTYFDVKPGSVSDVAAKIVSEGLDPVNKDAVKKKFDDRKDKDIDNDGDVDSSDKYLHKRRKAISKAVKKEWVEADGSARRVAEGDKRKKMEKVAEDKKSIVDIQQEKNQSMREMLAKIWGVDEGVSPFGKTEQKKSVRTPKTETGATLNTVMSNSFGFGGTNAALIFEKV